MLQKLNFKPGYNKQITDSAGESQWVDGDFVRFRYGLPEKIGGWQQLTDSNNTLPGAARAQHAFTSISGEKYVAIGTSQGLFLYYEGEFIDITPIDNNVVTGATFSTTSGSRTVTVSKPSHGLLDGRYITFSSVTVPTNSGYATTDFTNNTFEILNKTNDTFQITMPTNSSASSTTLNGALLNDANGTGGSGTSITLTSTSGFATSGIIAVGLESISYTGVSGNNLTGITRAVSGTRSAHSSGAVVSTGSAQIDPYVIVGPTFQTAGFGWGTASWGGASGVTSTLNGALSDNTSGTGGSGTSITLTSTTNFPITGGTIRVGAEYISYTGITGNNLTGITRAVAGTRSAHSTGASVEFYIAWGQQSLTSTVTLDPGLWSLDNFGQILTATIHNGETFTWNSGAASARNIRATIMANAPTKTRLTQVSDRDRHVFHFGTETTIGNSTTQDPMFIRFSDQENFNVYQPTAVNTAGTFRLDKGNEIVGAVSGKDYTLVLTDSSAYVIQYVGPPFTFSIRQVGTNCGLIGQNALSYSNGVVFWMSGEGGFFVFDGTVKTLPCLVEDFVFTTNGDNLGLNFNASQLIYCEHNTLYNEINWFYASSNSEQINRCVVYNYGEKLWTTSSLARTSYIDTGVYDLPYATEYIKTAVPSFPIQGITNTYGASTYYAQEIGTDQVNSSGTTSINAFIKSGDFDITAGKGMMGGTNTTPNFKGDGDYLMSVKRFIPDFKVLTGNSKITLLLNDYPSDTAASSPLGPFTITSTTDKIDTRARGRLLAVKIENDSTGETWRYGTLRIDTKVDGRR
tara:strand:- start:4212 stop:6611 length:2400 start_codon:yes stop_codon:yes gene_type:complete